MGNTDRHHTAVPGHDPVGVSRYVRAACRVEPGVLGTACLVAKQLTRVLAGSVHSPTQVLVGVYTPQFGPQPRRLSLHMNGNGDIVAQLHDTRPRVGGFKSLVCFLEKCLSSYGVTSQAEQ